MLTELEKKLGVVFKDKEILNKALTHPSSSEKNENYERLEFLGDSAINLTIADFLYHEFPLEAEGVLAKKRASLISRKALVKIAKKLELGNFLKISSSEEKNGGRTNESNLENALEALIGAIYIDAGFAKAKEIILEKWADLFQNIEEYKSEDPKSELQEILQAEGKKVPDYVVVQEEGPSHNPLFTIEIRAEGLNPVRATANSKKLASTEAAKKMLKEIKGE